MNKISFSLFMAAWGAVTLLPSCSLTEVGCAAGSIAGRAAAYAALESYERAVSQTGRGRHLSSSERSDIISVAEELGCLAGDRLFGVWGTYVEKRREAYRNDAEYLQAQIDDMNKMNAKADRSIDALDSQTSRMQQQRGKVKRLPALKSEMGSKLHTASCKRKEDAKQIEQYLVAAKNDSEKAVRTTSGEAQKAELRQQIAETDKRIERLRALQREISDIEANSRTTYAIR